MELDILKLHTTWNDAANSINTNFSKIQMAIASLGTGGGGLNEDELRAFLVVYLTQNGYATKDDIDNAISDIINGAPSTLDTLKEIADALAESDDIIAALNNAIGTKASKEELNEGLNTLANSKITISGVDVSLGGEITQQELRTGLGLETLVDWYNRIGVAFGKKGDGTYFVDGDFLANGQFAAAAVGTEGGGSVGAAYLSDLYDVSLGSLLSGDLLSWNGNEWVNIKQSSIVPDLSAYASKSFVSDALEGYLPKSGGIIDGGANDTPLVVKSNGSTTWIKFLSSDNTNRYFGVDNSNSILYLNNSGAFSLYHSGNFNPSDYLPLSGGTISGNLNLGGYLISNGHFLFARDIDNAEWVVTDKNWQHNYDILHSGNFGYFALPLSGGTMSGRLQLAGAGTAWLTFVDTNGNTAYGSIGVANDHTAVFNDGTSTKTLIHSGNIGSQSVAYASNAGTLGGVSLSNGSNTPWGTIPMITTGGYMDVGKHFEFHYDNTTGSDYSTVLSCAGNYGNFVWLPSASGTLALTTDNVASATKLATPRTIWGQSFDGTGDVAGDLHLNQSDIYWHGDKANYCIESITYADASPSLKIAHYGGIAFHTMGAQKMFISPYGVGVGVSTPNTALHVKTSSHLGITVESSTSIESSIVYKDSSAREWIAGIGVGGIENSFGFWTNTNLKTVMSLRTNGNVLIGTASDNGAKVSIVSTSAKTLALYRTTTGGGSFIDYHANNDTSNQWRVGHNYDSVGSSFVFNKFNGTTESTLVSIKENGNVLIGTRDDRGYKLDVNGTVRIGGDLNVGNNVIRNGDNTNIIDMTGHLAFGYGLRNSGYVSYWGYQHAFFVGDSQAMQISPNGNVLMGTTTDRGHRLTVGRPDGAANLTSTTLNNSLLFVGMSESVDSYGTNFWTEGSGNGFIQQGRTDEEQPALYDLILQPFGRNVGICTPNPQYTLDVAGNIGTRYGIVGYCEGTYSRWSLSHGSNTLYIQSGYTDGSSTNGTMMLSGVNTLNLEQLDVRANVASFNGSIVTNEITIGGIKLDVYDGALRVNGDIFSTGQFAAATAGEATGGNIVLDYASIVNALGYTPANNNNLAQVAFTGSYNSLLNTPSVYTKEEVYNKNEINQKLAGVGGSGGSVGSTFGMDYINGQSFDMPNGVNCITSYSDATVNFSSIVPADPSLPCIVYIVKCDYHTLQVTSGCNIVSVNSSGDEVIDFSINGMTGMMLVWEPDYWRWFAYLQK